MSANAERKNATAFAPATVANVAVGFDILGFAVESVGDRVTVSTTEEPSITVREIIGADGAPAHDEIPFDPARNTATVGLLALREDLKLARGFESRSTKASRSVRAWDAPRLRRSRQSSRPILCSNDR